jgi:hypothetical protein
LVGRGGGLEEALLLEVVEAEVVVELADIEDGPRASPSKSST